MHRRSISLKYQWPGTSGRTPMLPRGSPRAWGSLMGRNGSILTDARSLCSSDRGWSMRPFKRSLTDVSLMTRRWKQVLTSDRKWGQDFGSGVQPFVKWQNPNMSSNKLQFFSGKTMEFPIPKYTLKKKAFTFNLGLPPLINNRICNT